MTSRRRCQPRGSPLRETKRRSVQIPANRTHQRRDYQRLEVLETSAVKRRGRSFRSLIWWCQQQHRKTDRLEVNLALYLCSFRVKPRLPLPPYTSACLPALSVNLLLPLLCLLLHLGDECSGHEFFTDSVGGSGFAGLVVLEMWK